MAIIDGSAIRRRRGILDGDPADLRGGLPGANAALAGIPSPGAGGLGAGSPGPFEDVPGFGPPLNYNPIAPDVLAFQQSLAQRRGEAAGMEAVRARLAAQEAAGLGRFVDPATGQPAQFGQGRFLTRPAGFISGPGLFSGDDINDRIREIGDAVKRRLEELTGAPPSPPGFGSPVPPANVRRGRFGT